MRQNDTGTALQQRSVSAAERLLGMTLEEVNAAKRRLDGEIMSPDFSALPFCRRVAMQRTRIGLDYVASGLRMSHRSGSVIEPLLSIHDEPW